MVEHAQVHPPSRARSRWQPVNFSEPDEPDHSSYAVPPIEIAALLDELLNRPSWHAEAACKGQGPAPWFPGRGESTQPAKKICDGCPVSAECLTAALAIGVAQDAGVWSGTSVQQRRRLRRSAA